MKYIPKPIEGNVNISHSSPLRELCLLISGLLGLLILVYVILGFAVDWIAPRLPHEFEVHLGRVMSSAFNELAVSPADKALQKILDGLVAVSPLPPLNYRVHLIMSSEANAVALPGGHILVLSGLLQELDSENDLAFILAHELGHFANRDHLRGLGRGLVLTGISAALIGLDNALTEFLMQSLLKVEMKFSQQQERDADLFALDLLHARYGHIAGATDFFELLAQEEARGRLAYFFATHPYPQDRVDALRSYIREHGYSSGEEVPFNPKIQEFLQQEGEESKTFRDILKF